MWSPLSSNSHVTDYPNIPELFEQLLVNLSQQWFSSQLFGVWSHQTFCIETVSEKWDSQFTPRRNTEILLIEFDSDLNQFIIGYSPMKSNWSMRKEHGYWVKTGVWANCTLKQSVFLVEQLISRILFQLIYDKESQRYCNFNNELGFDAISHIHSNSDIYLPQEKWNESSLTALLVEDILISGHMAISFKVDDWWIIASNTDWFKIQSDLTINDYFTNLIRFPEQGPLSIHSEVLITAFAKEVVTLDRTSNVVVKGGINDSIINLNDKHPEWARLVAFKM
ncbi:hypothetical protein [Gimesia sp.]|uniref:hypothetical protein n=1 Tax=Gimesia sp. TaxID=2024833 RepID=UPI0032ECAEBC